MILSVIGVRKNWSMKTIKNQLFHVYSLTRFIDDSNSLNIPFSFYRIGADILETIISSSPPFSFLTDYAKWQAIAQPKERSAKPLFPPGSLMEPRFFSPFHVETLPRDCRSVLLSAFRLSEHNDLVFRGFSPTDHSPLSFLLPGIWDRRAWRKAKRPFDYECTPATRGVAPFWSPVWPPFSIIFRHNLSTRSSGPVSAWNSAGSMVSSYFFLLLIIRIIIILAERISRIFFFAGGEDFLFVKHSN